MNEVDISDAEKIISEEHFELMNHELDCLTQWVVLLNEAMRDIENGSQAARDLEMFFVKLHGLLAEGLPHIQMQFLPLEAIDSLNRENPERQFPDEYRELCKRLYTHFEAIQKLISKEDLEALEYMRHKASHPYIESYRLSFDKKNRPKLERKGENRKTLRHRIESHIQKSGGFHDFAFELTKRIKEHVPQFLACLQTQCIRRGTYGGQITLAQLKLNIKSHLFTPETRNDIRTEIIELAKKDLRISGGAVTGSVTIGKEDQWSDVDLAFGVKDKDQLKPTLEDFSKFMYANYNCFHHLDVLSQDWIYRVFFLENTLQVDIAFVHQSHFRALAPTFKLIFGRSLEPDYGKPRGAQVLAGWVWLYALHVRSSLARKRFWQTEFYISGMKDYVFSLMCVRFGLPTSTGRGIDELPENLKASLEEGLIKSLDAKELFRAFEKIMNVFISELSEIDEELASRLDPGLTSLKSQVKDLALNT